MNLKLLVVEDDELSRVALTMMLRNLGEVKEAANYKDAISLIHSNDFDISFIDLDLDEDLVGFKIIDEVVLKNGHAVVISGREEEQYIETAYQKGCLDYLGKPFQRDGLEMVLRRYNFLKNEGVLKDFFTYDYITDDDSVVEELRVIEDIVISDRPVFLEGPTGTGKTMIAKLIHQLVFDNDEKFVHLNCAEIPENLLESELFGYEKGAFSGADKKQLGKINLADGGTLFLDEIATLPLAVQKKLLKVLEEKSYYPLGSTKLEKSNFRLVSATCENLKELVKKSEFREDLFYRIHGFNISLKSLKERSGDIPLLIKHFLRKGQRRIVLSEEVKNAFYNYSWPGNIRQLKNIIGVLQTKSFGIIKLSDIPKEIQEGLESRSQSESVQKLNSQETNRNNNEKDEGHSYALQFLTKDMIEFYKEHGMKKLIEMVENDIVVNSFRDNKLGVRPTLDALKISSSAFYRVYNRTKENL